MLNNELRGLLDQEKAKQAMTRKTWTQTPETSLIPTPQPTSSPPTERSPLEEDIEQLISMSGHGLETGTAPTGTLFILYNLNLRSEEDIAALLEGM